MTSTAVPPAVATRLLWAAILASFISFLDGTIVNVALPSIERDLSGGIALQQWVVDGYLLSLGSLILVSGAVSDAFGRLRVLRVAVVAFAVTSLLCAASPAPAILIAARVLQGVAGALLVPGSLSLIIAVYSGPAQARAIGRWTAWTSVAGLLGPVAGGVLVDAVGWRWVFVLGVLPAAAAMLLLGRRRDADVADAADEPSRRIDVPSAVLAALGLAGIVGALIEAPRLGPFDPIVLGAAAVGIGCFVAFLRHDARSPRPLVPHSLFAHRNFGAGNLATLFVYGALSLGGLLSTLFLQETARLPATVAALTSLPGSIAMILLSGRFGALSGRYGPRWFMAAGPVLAGLGYLLLTVVPSVDVAFWWVLAGSVVFALGMAVTVAPLTAAVLGSVPERSSGIGSAVNNAVARVAGLVSTACAGALIGSTYDLGAFHRAAAVVAALLIAGGVVSALWIRNTDVRASGAAS